MINVTPFYGTYLHSKNQCRSNSGHRISMLVCYVQRMDAGHHQQISSSAPSPRSKREVSAIEPKRNDDDDQRNKNLNHSNPTSDSLAASGPLRRTANRWRCALSCGCPNKKLRKVCCTYSNTIQPMMFNCVYDLFIARLSF